MISILLQEPIPYFCRFPFFVGQGVGQEGVRNTYIHRGRGTFFFISHISFHFSLSLSPLSLLLWHLVNWSSYLPETVFGLSVLVLNGGAILD